MKTVYPPQTKLGGGGGEGGIKTKFAGEQMKMFLALSLSDVVFIMLINVKMPTIVGILTFMSRINFMLS